jgi:hypothetical protein
MKAKWLMLMLPLSATLHAAAAGSSQPAVGDFLYAIRQVESGDRYDGPAGPYGELGAYQFRAEVWHQYTTAPFYEARTSLADDIAVQHFWRLVQRLKSCGVAPTAWNLAAAWNSGFHAVISGRIPRTTRSYASRVSNLAQYSAEHRAPPVPVIPLALASN